MAKGQQRSTREEKKPKKERPKVAPPAASSISRALEKLQSRHSFGKRNSLDTVLARGNSARGSHDFFDTPFKRGVRARIVAGAFACLLL
jgi:hypothetical protein